MQLLLRELASIWNSVETKWLRLDIAWRWALRLHLGILVLFTIWAFWISRARPLFREELEIGLWPSTDLMLWLERILVYPTYRYDVLWYVGIASQGYEYRAGTTTFHPLYPLLIRLFAPLLNDHYLLAAWLVTQLCVTPLIAVLYKLIRLDFDDSVAQRATLFLLVSPVGFTFLIPYTESLLLLCIVGAFYAARTERWLIAGLAGAGAALAKQPGFLVGLPLLWEAIVMLRNRGWRGWKQPLVGLACIPLGLLSFVIFRASRHDVQFDLRKPFSLISQVVVSPDYGSVHHHRFGWPWESIMGAIQQIQETPTFYTLINVTLTIVFLALILYSIRFVRVSYSIYSILMATLSLTIIYEMWPMLSILRRLLIIFPVFILLALVSKKKIWLITILVLQVLLWAFLAELYVRNAYIL